MPRLQECWRSEWALALAATALLAPESLAGQTDTAATIRAARAATPLSIDGRLDDPAWRAARSATTFTQRQPDPGAPSTEETEVRIVYDREAIYVGARMSDSSDVSSRLGRRDAQLSGSDWFTIAFDSYHDHLTAFRFAVNPDGVRRDEKVSDGDDDDESWDPVWESMTRIDSAGWTAELRIPLSQLRFRDAPSQTWGVQITREISRLNEESWFAFTPKREVAGVARYGHLEGLLGLEAPGRLELLPYAVTRANYHPVATDPDARFSNPFTNGRDHDVSAGLDLKYRLASNLTLDATINPDFGQVEADPATINLTAFETQFSERRPFFVEGAEIFDFGTQLFYSRRIGAAPPGRLPAEEVYADMPAHASILGAVKVSGKVRGWSLGVLDAVTAREQADYVTATGERGRADVAPPANYAAARARRELRDGASVLGGMLTVTHRGLADEALASRLRASAWAGGIDFTHAWANRRWSLSGYLSGSRIAGRPSAITGAQRSSARYYQRPDATYLSLDTTATSLAGWAGSLTLHKEGGEHWRGRLSAETTSPGYETNDLGFQSRADEHELDGSIDYVMNEPGRILRQWDLSLQPQATWNFGGDRLASTLELEGSAELRSYWSGDFEVRRSLAALDDRLTRGGPLARVPGSTAWQVSIESDARRPLTVDMSVERATGAAGSSLSLDVELGFKPAPSLDLSIGPAWTRERSTGQYLTTVADPLATAMGGHRYVFADLDQREIALDIRANHTFSPALTLELFLRPFIGSGRFGTPKELVAPRTFRFTPYGDAVLDDHEWTIDPDGDGPAATFAVDDEDFTLRSLKGDAVLRWEWRPGSTLYLVWQQEREEEVPLGDVRLGRDFRRLTATRPRNVFMLKASYWFNR